MARPSVRDGRSLDNREGIVGGLVEGGSGMKKIWLCCAALAVLGLMGFAGSSTLGGLTPVGDDDAAQLTGGACGWNYWTTICSGCGQASVCPYTPPQGGTRKCYWVYSAVSVPSQTCAFNITFQTNSTLSANACYDCGQLYAPCGSYYYWVMCSP